MSTLVPTYPSISALVAEDPTGELGPAGRAAVGELTINGTSHPIGAESLAWLRGGVIARCALIARQVQRPVRLSVTEREASYELAVHPDAFVQPLSAAGTVEDLDAGDPRPIGAGRCWRCRRLQPLRNVYCEQCGTEHPHDIEEHRPRNGGAQK